MIKMRSFAFQHLRHHRLVSCATYAPCGSQCGENVGTLACQRRKDKQTWRVIILGEFFMEILETLFYVFEMSDVYDEFGVESPS